MRARLRRHRRPLIPVPGHHHARTDGYAGHSYGHVDSSVGHVDADADTDPHADPDADAHAYLAAWQQQLQ